MSHLVVGLVEIARLLLLLLPGAALAFASPCLLPLLYGGRAALGDLRSAVLLLPDGAAGDAEGFAVVVFEVDDRLPSITLPPYTALPSDKPCVETACSAMRNLVAVGS